MTDQELKEVRERLEAATPGPWEANYRALKNLIEHAPNDISRLLNEVERLQKILSKAGLCSFCGEELDSELKTGGMLTGASICYGCVEAIKK
jgi:hypothetical protein